MQGAGNKSLSKKSRLLILIGFAFFINPVPLGFDILPDAFGCALIYFGLTQLSYFDGSIEQSRKAFLYLFIVEAVKLFTMRSTATANISSNRMLAVTSFSIIEVIIYFMIFKHFFEGIGYYSMRHNCNDAMKLCDDASFMTYLSFFIRIGAALLPELLAMPEVLLYADEDVDIELDTLELIADIVSAKPILVVLFSIIAFIAGIAWYAKLSRLIKSFFRDAGEELDVRYASEYTSKPQLVRPKRLKAGSYALYFSLFFAADIVFDGIRFVPASAMFLLLLISTHFFKGISGFKLTKRRAMFAFLLLLITEVYRAILVPNGAVAIYETDFWIVGIAAIICLVTAPVCLITVRGFLADLRSLSTDLGGETISTKGAWISYCVTLTLWAAGFVVPYFYNEVSSLRFIGSCVFIWQSAKVISRINDEEVERVSLYGPQ